MTLRVQERFTVLPRTPGEYHAFPTLALADGMVWCACRSGRRDLERPHGREGRVQLLCTTPGRWTDWEGGPITLEPVSEPPCELDALFSPLSDGRVVLATREYRGEGITSRS